MGTGIRSSDGRVVRTLPDEIERFITAPPHTVLTKKNIFQPAVEDVISQNITLKGHWTNITPYLSFKKKKRKNKRSLYTLEVLARAMTTC